MPDVTFYVRNRGKISGPYDTAALQKLVRRGLLSRVQEVSGDRVTWNRAGDYEELFPAPVAATIETAEHGSEYETEVAGPAVTAFPQTTAHSASETAAEYYYAQSGVAVGPVALSVLKMLAQTGTLQSEDLVWREGDQTGTPARQVPALAPMFTSILQYAAPRPIESKFAGFWIRFGAWVVDTIIIAVTILIAAVAAGFVLSALMAAADAPGREIYEAGQLTGFLIGFLTQWFYYAFFESSAKQATPGKIAVGIMVVSENGQRISFGRATGRFFGKYISGLILCIGYFMAGWTQKKQALHDLMAGTLVVNK